MNTDAHDQVSSSTAEPDSEGNKETILYKRVKSQNDGTDGEGNISTLPLSYHLSYLFGTEETVKMRRQLVFLREKLWNIQLGDGARVVCGGSLGEGVAFPKSDDDVMFYRTCYRVVKTLDEGTKEGDLLMAAVGGNPGYCMLYNIHGKYDGDSSKDTLFCYKGRPLMSSSQVKQYFMTVSGGERIHGPCSSFSIGPEEYDHAFSIPCSFWPDSAREWLNRNRPYDWPSQEMIAIVERSRWHVVPIGNPDSLFCEHEWRMSFLVAERMLMHSFNHSQFLTYNLLRTALKVEIEDACEDVLCSYFMKTILFYKIENTPPQQWELNNLESCFQICLSMLYDNIQCLKMPNYFIQDNNLIQRKVNHINKPLLLQCIRGIRKEGIRGILRLSEDSQYSWKSLSLSEIEWKQDKDFFFSRHLIKVRSMIQLDVCLNEEDCVESYISTDCNNFAQCLKEDETSTCYEFSDILSQTLYVSCCLKLMHDNHNLLGKNEHDDVNVRIESLLQSGPNADVSTRKLTMATYLFLSGNIESALSTVCQLLSEFPSYVIDESYAQLNNETYQKVACGRGFTIAHKAKLAWAPAYSMSNSILNAFPHPIKILSQIVQDLHLTSITYALFVECLCYVHLQKNIFILKSTRCLIRHMKDLEKEEKKNRSDIAAVRICVGIIKDLHGDKQSACRWFRAAYMFFKHLDPPLEKTLSLSALTYTACLINKT